MLPIDFIVIGTPRSLQSRGKGRVTFKEKVRLAAAERLESDHLPHAGPARVTIYYFHENRPADLDNIVKPILDGMNGVAYVDDEQVIDLITCKRDVRAFTATGDLPVIILDWFLSSGGTRTSFIYVRVEAADSEVIS